MSGVVGLVVVGVLAGCGHGPLNSFYRPGPLAQDDSSSVWWHEARQDQVFTDGLNVLSLPPESGEAKILAVRSVGGDKAMTFLGATIGLPGRPNDFDENEPGYPPKALPEQYRAPAVGAVLKPGNTYMLAMGYRVIHADVPDRRRSIVVDYQIGDTRYQAVLKSGLVSCPPPLTDSQCSKKYR